jgi:hypothetical protein
MPATTISAPTSSNFGTTRVRGATSVSRIERRELRVIELNVAHVIEIKRLDVLLETAKQRIFLSGRQRG